MTSSPLSVVGSQSRRPGLLIGDAERDAACQSLATHFAAGRLTADELDSRVNAAMAARTNVELHLLTADLPRTPSADQPPAHPPASMVPMVPMAVMPPRSQPARDGAAAVLHGLGVLVTLAAIGCTSLLLMAVMFGSSEVGPVAWLASFGTAVSVGGAMYYGGQLVASRRARVRAEAEAAVRQSLAG